MFMSDVSDIYWQFNYDAPLTEEYHIFTCRASRLWHHKKRKNNFWNFMYQPVPNVTITPGQIFKNCQIPASGQIFGQIPGGLASVGPLNLKSMLSSQLSLENWSELRKSFQSLRPLAAHEAEGLKGHLNLPFLEDSTRRTGFRSLP